MLIQQIISGLSLGSIYALMAVGYALVFNILKFSNFSHGGLMAVSAYITYFFTMKLKDYINSDLLFIAALFISAAAGLVVGLVVERISFRRLRKKKGHIMYYFVSSVTMGILLENLINIFYGSNFYSYPFSIKSKLLIIGSYRIPVIYIVMLGIAMIALIGLILLINKTKFGVALRAVSEDFSTAGLMGIDVNLVVMATFAMAGTLGGISGMLTGINYTLYPQLGNMVVKGFISSVIGGLGSVYGAVIAALCLGVTEIFLIKYIGSGFTPVCLFVIVIVFLIFRPRGIAGKLIQEKV